MGIETQGVRVLIVEDEPAIRDLLDVFLTSEGFETHVVGDGRAALHVAAREMPDLILMDLMLPIVDGATATRQLKSDSSTQRIPVVAMSADVVALSDTYALPADSTIRKPFDLDVLLHQIRQHLVAPLHALAL